VRELVQVEDAASTAEAGRLFREYAAWVDVDLSFQGFDAELAQLPGDYVPPNGLLLLARLDGQTAGCVAAHEWEPGVCEMKRLFVRKAFRGTGCGRALVEHVVAWARQAGYRRIVLDTLPSMADAQSLYSRLGFVEIPPYRPNPIAGARFLELALN
jgi:GNAT superfamily N-acetyltransferase